MFDGAFGGRRALAETGVMATPLIFGGLAFAVAARAGMFNIGIEGQLMMGGLAAGLVAGADLGLSPIVWVPLSLICGALSGAVWGAIPGILKARSGAHEVISTIMLNYIAFRINRWLIASAADWLPVNTELKSTKRAYADARLPNLLDGTRLHAGLLVAIGVAVLLWWVLFRTTFGYRIRTVGLSRGAAAYGGFSWGWTIVVAMAISGAYAGLAGASEAVGLQGAHYGDPPGYGFTSIAVGLVGQNHPIGVIFSGLVFGALRSGANAMQNQVGVSKEIVQVLQGLVILAVSAIPAVAQFRAWRARRTVRRPPPGAPDAPDDTISTTIGVEPSAPPPL
jgi:simple sugar transport system permease protein